MSCTIVLWHVDVAVSVWISFCGTCNLYDMFGPHVQKKNLKQVSSKLMWKSISFCTGLSNLVSYYIYISSIDGRNPAPYIIPNILPQKPSGPARRVCRTCHMSWNMWPPYVNWFRGFWPCHSMHRSWVLEGEKPSELVPSLCFTSWWICFGGWWKENELFLPWDSSSITSPFCILGSCLVYAGQLNLGFDEFDKMPRLTIMLPLGWRHLPRAVLCSFRWTWSLYHPEM